MSHDDSYIPSHDLQGSPAAKAVYQDVTDYCEEGVWYNDGFAIRYYAPTPDLESCRNKCVAEHDAKFFSYCPDHPDGKSDICQLSSTAKIGCFDNLIHKVKID